MACGILVPQPGIKPTLPALEAQCFNHWTIREVTTVFLCVENWPEIPPGMNKVVFCKEITQLSEARSAGRRQKDGMPGGTGSDILRESQPMPGPSQPHPVSHAINGIPAGPQWTLSWRPRDDKCTVLGF